MLILTRFLYCLDEVKINLLLSLLKKNEFREVIFWASEIYYSGFKKELWDYTWKIYYDFYALSNKKIAKQFDEYQNENNFRYILKLLFTLFHSKFSFDVFIVNNLYKASKLSKKTIEKTKISNIMKMLDFYSKKKQIKKFTIKLKHALQINKDETIKFIFDSFGTHEINVRTCLFQQLFLISQGKGEKSGESEACGESKASVESKAIVESKCGKRKRIIKISKVQMLYALKLNNFNYETPFNILKKMRHFSISEYTNGFNLEREKVNLKELFQKKWEYHANFSPSWNEKFKLHKGKSNKKKEMVFKNYDSYDEFYEKYNLEPGEQDLETQEKSIKTLKKYDTPEIISLLFGDNEITLGLDNKIDFEKVKY